MSEEQPLGSVTNIMADMPKKESHKRESSPEVSRRVRKSVRHLEDSKADVKLIVLTMGVLFVAFMLIVRYSISSRQAATGSEANQSSDGLYYTVKVSNSRSQNAPTTLLMSITNTSGVPKTLDFTKDTKVDFVVQQQLNVFFAKVPVELWRYSKAHANMSAQRKFTILPNEERVFSVKWNRTDNKGERILGGRYIVTGEINTSSGSQNSSKNS